MGAYRAHMIQQFINGLLPYTSYGNFGIVSYAYCPQSFNVPITSLKDKNYKKPTSDVHTMTKHEKIPSLTDVVRQMRRDLNERGAHNAKHGRVGSKAAVLFVDPFVTDLTPELMAETEMLKQSGSKLFLVNVGQGGWHQSQYLYSMSSQPYINYIYTYPTYDQLLYSVRNTPSMFRSMFNRYIPYFSI